MAFSTGVYEHPQFELLHLLSELYKGSSLPLYIDFRILNIWLFMQVYLKLTSHNIILSQIITRLFIKASM
jgi:hypothetical protein